MNRGGVTKRRLDRGTLGTSEGFGEGRRYRTTLRYRPTLLCSSLGFSSLYTAPVRLLRPLSASLSFSFPFPFLFPFRFLDWLTADLPGVLSRWWSVCPIRDPELSIDPQLVQLLRRRTHQRSVVFVVDMYTRVWACVIYIRDKFYRLSDALANAGNRMLLLIATLMPNVLRSISQRSVLPTSC